MKTKEDTTKKKGAAAPSGVGKFWILRNLALAIVVIGALVIITNVSLSIITQHSKVLTVPDFTNMTATEAAKVAEASNLRVIVSDSVYVRRMRPGAVYMQNPKAGELVKKGRRIRLTTNTTRAKQVNMPSLVGCSLRQAKAELLRSGLLLGKLYYVNDIATNIVLKQQVLGRNIEPGKPLTSGTTVNLVLGLNADDTQTFVPRLYGQQYLKAIDMLQENSLNPGQLRFDSSVKDYADSVSAMVYFQNPVADSISIRKGSDVTLYFTLDPEKLKQNK